MLATFLLFLARAASATEIAPRVLPTTPSWALSAGRSTQPAAIPDLPLPPDPKPPHFDLGPALVAARAGAGLAAAVPSLRFNEAALWSDIISQAGAVPQCFGDANGFIEGYEVTFKDVSHPSVPARDLGGAWVPVARRGRGDFMVEPDGPADMVIEMQGRGFRQVDYRSARAVRNVRSSSASLTFTQEQAARSDIRRRLESELTCIADWRLDRSLVSVRLDLPTTASRQVRLELGDIVTGWLNSREAGRRPVIQEISATKNIRVQLLTRSEP